MSKVDLSSILNKNEYKKRTITGWENGNYLNATICVTEECNLACTYCYMVGKNNFHRMSFDIAKKIVDFLITDPYCTGLTDNLMVDFIGGEPLLEIDLIDKISDYICMSMYLKNHKWFNHFQITFSTNGTLYDTPKVQHFLSKHRKHCGFGFSIDGTKEKHDLTRKTKDGKGSYDLVINGFKRYKEQYGEDISQKSTFSSPDLKYLKDSIIHLWDLGFKDVQSNLVYENVWKEGDAEIFEQQLKDLADYMFESGRYKTHSVAYFDKRRGLPISKMSLHQNRCGAGYKSLAFDCEGNIYPCIRFLDMCDENKKSKVVGNIWTGIDYNALRALCGTTWQAVSNEKCKNCEVGTDCGWCVALNYQENGTLYERTTSICEMHKANVRANKYFWKRYEEITGKTSDRVIEKVLYSQHNSLKYVYFIMSDKAPSFCNYNSKIQTNLQMSEELVQKGLAFCLDNEALPIFLGTAPDCIKDSKKIYFEIDTVKKFNIPERGITVVKSFDSTVSTAIINYILDKSSIKRALNDVKKYYQIGVLRINLFISDLQLWNEYEINEYDYVVNQLADFIADIYSKGNFRFQINILSDRLNMGDDEYRDCAAGINSIALAPNGNFYICPGFYFEGLKWNIGNIDSGVNFTQKDRLFRDRSPMCCDCKAMSCSRCLLNNEITTQELNVPSVQNCKINYIQTNAQLKLLQKLKDTMGDNYCFLANNIQKLDYIDYVANMIYKDERAIAKKWMY